jgi:RNA polymerase sigma-70 factor (ECF subfamily)
MTTHRVASGETNFASRITAMTPEEFTSTYRQVLPQITKYLVRRVSPSDVEDLASRIFELAWTKRSEAPKGFELPWLYRIAGFVVANHRRSEKAKESFLALFRPKDSAPSAEDIALSDLGLSEAWAKLTPAERQVISLSSFEGLDNSDSARVLEISTNAFALRLSKAKAKLRGLIS